METDGDTRRTRLLQTWNDHIARQDVRLTLTTEFPDEDILRQCPVVFTRDLEFFLEAQYPQVPRPNEPWGRTTESIALMVCAETVTSQGEAFQENLSANGVGITIDFELVPNGREPAGELETRSIRRIIRSRISGLTSEDIVLTDYWSQTGYPQRHNWNHWFVLQPALAPGLSNTTKQQLKSADIQWILVTAGIQNEIAFVGYDGVKRSAP